MKIDNLLLFYSNSFVAVSARDLGILHGKMHIIPGRVDRLAAKFKSWCNIYRSRFFFVSYKNISHNLRVHWKRLSRRFR